MGANLTFISLFYVRLLGTSMKMVCFTYFTSAIN